MGKCSGLKGGGHHRKAIDVADKKRNEKKSRKKDQEAAGKRALALQEILGGKLGSMHKDCDIYLHAEADGSKTNNYGSSNINDTTCTTELCRSYFRWENCCNRRCKFSHEHSIAEALQNVISGSAMSGEGDGDCAPTIPAVRYLPGIIGGGRGKRQQRSRWKQPSTSAEHVVEQDGVSSLSLITPSPMENALLEGSSVVNTIVAYLDSNRDVLHLALSCRYLHHVVLLDSSNSVIHAAHDIEEGCQDVRRRKQQVKEVKLDERNQLLLKSKVIGGRLRYVVSYLDGPNPRGGRNSKKNSKKKNKNRNDTATSRNPTQRWPILIYDYENPHVFQAFREAPSVTANVEE